MGYGYSIELDAADAEVTAKASGRDLPIKPRYSINVCAAIRGKDLAWAKAFLEDVVAKKRAVPFKRHKGGVSHRKGGVGPGKYPVKAAAAILKVVENAENNAEYKGLDPDELFVYHAAAQRAAPIEGFMPRAQGRSSAWNKATSHIEIVLKEKEE